MTQPGTLLIDTLPPEALSTHTSKAEATSMDTDDDPFAGLDLANGNPPTTNVLAEASPTDAIPKVEENDKLSNGTIADKGNEKRPMDDECLELNGTTLADETPAAVLPQIDSQVEEAAGDEDLVASDDLETKLPVESVQPMTQSHVHGEIDPTRGEQTIPVDLSQSGDTPELSTNHPQDIQALDPMNAFDQGTRAADASLIITDTCTRADDTPATLVPNNDTADPLDELSDLSPPEVNTLGDFGEGSVPVEEMGGLDGNLVRPQAGAVASIETDKMLGGLETAVHATIANGEESPSKPLSDPPPEQIVDTSEAQEDELGDFVSGPVATSTAAIPDNDDAVEGHAEGILATDKAPEDDFSGFVSDPITTEPSIETDDEAFGGFHAGEQDAGGQVTDAVAQSETSPEPHSREAPDSKVGDSVSDSAAAASHNETDEYFLEARQRSIVNDVNAVVTDSGTPSELLPEPCGNDVATDKVPDDDFGDFGDASGSDASQADPEQFPGHLNDVVGLSEASPALDEADSGDFNAAAEPVAASGTEQYSSTSACASNDGTNIQSGKDDFGTFNDAAAQPGDDNFGAFNNVSEPPISPAHLDSPESITIMGTNESTVGFGSFEDAQESIAQQGNARGTTNEELGLATASVGEDDFGEFNDGGDIPTPTPASHYIESEEDEFGDFDEATASSNETGLKEKKRQSVGEFPNIAATIDDDDGGDDFGDFDEAIAITNHGEEAGGDDNEFGDFGEALDTMTATDHQVSGADDAEVAGQDENEDDDFGDFDEALSAANHSEMPANPDSPTQSSSANIFQQLFPDLSPSTAVDSDEDETEGQQEVSVECVLNILTESLRGKDWSTDRKSHSLDTVEKLLTEETSKKLDKGLIRHGCYRRPYAHVHDPVGGIRRLQIRRNATIDSVREASLSHSDQPLVEPVSEVESETEDRQVPVEPSVHPAAEQLAASETQAGPTIVQIPKKVVPPGATAQTQTEPVASKRDGSMQAIDRDATIPTPVDEEPSALAMEVAKKIPDLSFMLSSRLSLSRRR